MFAEVRNCTRPRDRLCRACSEKVREKNARARKSTLGKNTRTYSDSGPPRPNQNSFKHMPAIVEDPVKYKTTMCQNWSRSGSCPYKWRCQFAHGSNELRPRAKMTAGVGPVKTLPRRSSIDASERASDDALSYDKGNEVTAARCAVVAKDIEFKPLGHRDLQGVDVRRLNLQFGQIQGAVYGGAAACFVGRQPQQGYQVPEHIRQVWTKSDKSAGKIELEMKQLPCPPLVTRSGQFSDLVRRTLSFVLED